MIEIPKMCSFNHHWPWTVGAFSGCEAAVKARYETVYQYECIPNNFNNPGSGSTGSTGPSGTSGSTGNNNNSGPSSGLSNTDGSITTPVFDSIEEKTHDKNCQHLKKLAESPNYENNIAFLKVKASGSKEHAWVYKYFENSSNFASPTVAGHNSLNPSRVHLEAFDGVEWVGAMHNHTVNGIRMFSPGDVGFLYNKARKKRNFQQQNNQPVIVNDLFLGLVNVDQVYCLKIKDLDKFLTFNLKFKEFERKLLKAYSNISSDASQSQLQKDILKLFNEYDLGLSLYEQNQNGNWSEISLDQVNPNNDPIKNPCN